MNFNQEAPEYKRTQKIYSKLIYNFIVSVILISSAEIIIMFVLSMLPSLPSYIKALLDGLSLIIIVPTLLYFIVIKPYIAERRHTEEKLITSESNYRSIVESTEDSIYSVDRNCNYLFVNKKHLTRMGLSTQQMKGRPFSEFHTQEETKLFIERVNNVFETGKSAQYEYRSLRDGRYFLQTYSPVQEEEGKIEAVTIISKNVTMLKHMEKELLTLSFSDDLTGLYNRRGFFNLMEHQLKVAKRNKSRTFMLYADLDNLKWINDTFGHQEGDAALIETANILKATYRESDIIARIGGDEFVLYPVGTNETSAENIAARLHKNLENQNAKSTRSYKLSISIGITSYDPETISSIDGLLAQADKLMYEHKRSKQRV